VRLPVLLCVALMPVQAAVPGWWTAFSRMPSMESRFRQESESAVFGKLAREGRLALYRVEAFGGETVKLTPRETTLPELKATGRKGLLHTLEWTDPTGARQRLELLDPKSPVTLSPATFKFQVPANTRWSTPNG